MRHHGQAVGNDNRSKAGFTLVEVMLGLFIFTMATMGVMGLSGTTWKDTGCAEAFTQAAVTGSRQLEMMFSARYVANDPLGMNPGVIAGPHNTTVGRYNINYVISDGAVLEDTKSVQMNVNFNCGGRQKSVRYNYVMPLRLR